MFHKRSTSFGEMTKIDLQADLEGEFEVMTFRRPGKSHSHDRREFAILVSGTGAVWIDGVAHRVAEETADEIVEVPAGAQHLMVPDSGQTLVMVILYAKY